MSGPVTGGKGIPFTSALPEVLEPAGYREDEYLFSGTAVAYQPKAGAKLDNDGQWDLEAVAPAEYKSRVLVRRPEDPAKFSGNVIVEWFNVSGGIDVDPDFPYLYPEALAAGDAYVGVSAQKSGIDGSGTIIPGAEVKALKEHDPERYGSLVHPGDQYSYDIFSQVGQALKKPGAVDLLGGLRAEHVIAAGESQSAMRMASYVNGVHPVAKVYDGFFVHSRGGSAVGFGAGTALSMPQQARVRTDLDVPVMQFITEGDLLAFFSARQPDTDMVRTWEIAGTAHADQWMLDYQNAAVGRVVPGVDTSFVDCPQMNDGPGKYVARRAIADLKKWVAGGPAPAKGEPIQATSGTAIARDEHGNALGGIRTSDLDVPIATHLGLAINASEGLAGVFCGIFGSTVPFDAAKLQGLYPTHDEYVSKVTAATEETVTAGFIREEDADEIVEAARNAPVPPPGA